MAATNQEFTREQYLEKPLPSSAESERVILGAILLDNQLIAQAIENLKSDDFYSPLHRKIFSAMTSLFERGERIDPILIGEELKKDGLIDSIGGVAAITNLTYGLPHFSDIQDYAKVVKDKSMVRSLIKVCNQITSEALAEEDDAVMILDHAEQMIFALADERTRQGFAHVRPIAETVLARVQEYAKRETHALTGLATGFRELDDKTSGLQKTDLIIVAARPSMGKCLEANSLVLVSDGSLATIEEIFQRKSAEILTLKDDLRFGQTEPSDFIDDGIKPVFRVTTRLGRQIETTLTHPYLTINGWKKLRELKTGEKIAVPRVLSIFGKNRMRNCETKILAYFLGSEGTAAAKSWPEFAFRDCALEKDFVEAVGEFGEEVEAVRCDFRNGAMIFTVRKAGEKTQGENDLTSRLKSLGVSGCGTSQKFIPEEIFTLEKKKLALFLNRLFAAGGRVSILTDGRAQIEFSSAGERMCRQIQHLLLRFGVIASLKNRPVKHETTGNAAWQLDITGAESIKAFAREINIFGKEDMFEKILQMIEARHYQNGKDITPEAARKYVSAVKACEPAAANDHANNHAGERAFSPDRAAKFTGGLKDEYEGSLTGSEIYWDEIVSIEYTGNKQVYDLTVPETHNFVANDICVHNTALCLTLAQNAAILEGAVVAVFSLEMSKEQLVMRMISSEAKVDAHRFRTGYLTREEWGRLAGAIGTLSDARIFIDDTPGISVLEMRAKTRRLVSEQKKIDLIVVDYLQLMSGSRRSESRQQEVSQISRELKGLAKELDVPIVALSQLSRAPEARNPPRPMMSDLRESGCLAGESLVTMADTGERIPIRDLAGRKGFRVWALNEQTRKIEKAMVTNAFSTGVKPTLKLKTRLGREIRATANHKFFSFNGWKRLDELKAGERIALPRQIENETEQMFAGVSAGQSGGARIYRQNIGREGACGTAAETVSSNEILQFAGNGVYWDEIASIEPDREVEVFDLTVENLANFECNGLIVHNSIEQDADVVAFIYREDYYKPTEENAGLAEIIISKQRNGPTGTVKLAFLKEFTRFENYFGE